jgi:UDP-N-acetylmuramate: L-alanyl-gamma-D-glutamyl-meso-diaminopimelate ligase
MASRTVHFIGIAGIGMSAAALLMREQGWYVTGSDEAFYPPASDVLRDAGIPIKSPHDPANIPSGVARIVVGKHAKLTMDNPEVRKAYGLGVPVSSYPEILSEIVAMRRSWVIAGSYGKSTTSAILAWTLSHGGVDAGYFVGAISKGMKSASHLGAHPVFVLEGDEYPSSNEDPRAKFLHYRAHDVLLTSASHDHVNIYPTQEDYLKPFRALLRGLPKDGLAVISLDEGYAAGLTSEATCPVVTYSLDNPGADYCARNIAYGATTRFTLVARGRGVARLETTMLGAHNIHNLIGASAIILERGLLTPEKIAAAFAAFPGVKRRMDRLTVRSRAPLYEGFGSSLDKARSAIEAMRLHFPERKLAVVFEPHTFSWRSRATLHWYDTAFKGVDLVVILPPPTHGATPSDQVSQSDIARYCSRIYGERLKILTPEMDAWVKPFLPKLDADTVVLALSSGSMGGSLPELAASLDEKFG